MAKNAKSERNTQDGTANPNTFFTASWTKFVNVELTKSDKEDWAVWTMDVNLYDLVDIHTALGRVITTKIDVKQNCGICTILERDTRSPNAGKMVSARGATPSIALSRALFIVDQVFGSDAWEGLVAVNDNDRW